MRGLAVRWARLLRERTSFILCYHGVGPTSLDVDPGFLRIRPDIFRRQLDTLSDASFEFVTVSEFVERANGSAPPPGLVALTFDDGMDDNHSIVRPILEEYGATGTFYVTTGFIGQPNPWMTAGSGLRMMTLEELGGLVACRFEIGAHTVSHPDMSMLGYESCFREASESRRLLEESLGVSVRSFAYPLCRYGPAAVAAVRAVGFDSAVTCGSGVGSWDRYELPRVMITGKDGVSTFVLKLAGVHGPLSSSPPGRLLRRVTRPYRTRRRLREQRTLAVHERWGRLRAAASVSKQTSHEAGDDPKE